VTVPLRAGFHCHPTHTTNYESSFFFHHNTPPPSGPCALYSIALFVSRFGMIGATARTAGANKHSAGEGEGCDTR